MSHAQSDSIGKLSMALSKAQAQFSGAAKNSTNPHFKSKYADLWECIAATKDILAEHELAVIQTFSADTEDIIINTTLAHSSGEWVRGSLKMKPKKDDDQGRGSSITYGRRYSYAAIVGLAQKDDDGQAAVEPERRSQGKVNGTAQKPESPLEERPPLLPENTKDFKRAVAIYRKEQSLEKVRQHRTVSEDVAVMVFDAAADPEFSVA
jgi:hypothetical protein